MGATVVGSLSVGAASCAKARDENLTKPARKASTYRTDNGINRYRLKPYSAFGRRASSAKRKQRQRSYPLPSAAPDVAAAVRPREKARDHCDRVSTRLEHSGSILHRDPADGHEWLRRQRAKRLYPLDAD